MDVILGMEWMNQHKVILDISDRVIEINSLRSGTLPSTYLLGTVPILVPM
jgi:hypothetical protein